MNVIDIWNNTIESFIVKCGKRLAAYVNLNKLSEKVGANCDNTDGEQFAIMLCEIIIHNSILLFLLFIIANILNIKLLTLLFISTFIPLRRCFGGFHVTSNFLCLIISLIVPVLTSILSLHITIDFIFLIMIYIFAFYTALKIGVVDSDIKRLNFELKTKLKREGIITLLVIFTINIYLYLNKNILVSNIMGLAVMMAFINLYFGKQLK